MSEKSLVCQFIFKPFEFFFGSVVDSRDMCVGMVGCEWERGGGCWDGMVSVQLHIQIHPKMDMCRVHVWGDIIYSDPSISGLGKGTNNRAWGGLPNRVFVWRAIKIP